MKRILGMALFAAACVVSAAAAERTVVIYTSVDQVFAQPVFKELEKKTGLTVRAVFDTEETKSTGVLNRLIAEGANPQADVFWSGDPVRPFSLVKRGLVEPYAPAAAADVPAQLRAADGTWTGVGARARVLLVNRERLGKRALPRSVRSLADPAWKGQAAMANPLFGTTTMHMAALFSTWGDAKAKEFLEGVKANGTRIASSNGEVKRLVVAGEVTFGLTDTDDAHEAAQGGAPVEIVYPDQDAGGVLVMPTTVVKIKGGPNADTANLAIDFLVSADTERMLTVNGAHMPLRASVKAPAGVKAVESLKAMTVDYAKVGAEMERIQPWLREWVGL